MKLPMLVAIPFWNGDKERAMDLCKLIAGLQTHPVRETLHIMLVARQDCTHDVNMVNIIKAKFTCYTYVTPSPLRGWPNGPNGMFGRSISHIANASKNRYECLYWMEPDAIPLCPNWYMDLLQAWKDRHPDALVVGCRSDCNGDGSGDHITGCALYHPLIAKKMPELTGCTGQAWDYKYRQKIVAVGGHTHMIENWYNQKNADPSIVDRVEKGVRIIHGFKDRSVIEAVAKKFAIKI